MISIAATFLILPSFQRIPYADHQSTPSLEQKKHHILCLGAALVHSQGDFIGPFNGSNFMCIDFISLVANAYGAKLSYYKPGEAEALGETKASAFSRKSKWFIKNDRRHRFQNELVADLRKFHPLWKTIVR